MRIRVRLFRLTILLTLLATVSCGKPIEQSNADSKSHADIQPDEVSVLIDGDSEWAVVIRCNRLGQVRLGTLGRLSPAELSKDRLERLWMKLDAWVAGNPDDCQEYVSEEAANTRSLLLVSIGGKVRIFSLRRKGTHKPLPPELDGVWKELTGIINL